MASSLIPKDYLGRPAQWAMARSSIDGAYNRSPQHVDGTRAERVLSRELSCKSATSEEFQLNGKFRVFRAHVGLVDYSDSDSQVKFVVRVDGEDRGSTVMRVKELQPVNIDVSGGSQMELYAEVTDSGYCNGSAIAAWVNPVVTR